MRRLRKTDSTSVHRRAARYHIAQCRLVSETSHTTLADQMQPRYATLVARARELDEAVDDASTAAASADAAEVQLENVVRDTDGVLARMDRENPALNARRTVFPEGYTPVIYPEKRAQLDTLPQVRSDLNRFAGYEEVAAQLAKLDAAEARFRAALQVQEKAEEKVELATIAERAARREVREQMQVSYGRLGELYKSWPQRVDQFFLRQKNQPKDTKGSEGKDGDEGKAQGEGKAKAKGEGQAKDAGKAEGTGKADVTSKPDGATPQAG